MHQLIYFSRNTMSGDLLKGLKEILGVSQRNNQRDGVTGSLIFDKVWFLQILEGNLEIIQATYKRIEKDSRHREATVMTVRPLIQRQFPDWGMGGLLRSPDVQEIFLSHGIGGEMDPRKLHAATVVDLALDLKAFDQRKRSDICKAS
ncbi:BLUF domain-containing protein [Chthonobacter rhizosphaerae]|uniref:BLUF domain-containing protein n=1 Tax=Chthonobacter rhizosphaerae TaxID=2735553 RepID=UPI0015EFC42D|nr:BLUF domain-containing protein [Chthonobacter rhizosphaerae]